MKRIAIVFLSAIILLSAFSSGYSSPASALSGSDFKAGRIIDDAVFNYSSSMSIAQIQQFLDSKMPSCDRWGTQSYAGTTRRAYGESRGVVFPLTCLNGYYENTSTKANNLEGRAVPSGAKSAANIIYDAAQQYSINPQVLIVLLQKEQNLILDDWPWPIQYRAATGYGCPDTAPCDSEYYGFYNQVNNAARQFRRYATYPNDYNYVTGSNFIQWNPQASCGGNTVQIESQSTASLYNYTPYQPNQAALNNLYGTGDSCSAYGNRNFWRLYSDWFGSTTIFDPYGWQVIKTSTDSREYLVVGNTKRWIPSGSIYADWNLGLKPAVTVSQGYLDSIPTLPALGRLGYYNNTYYYVNGGKKYSLTNDALMRAWGEINNKAIAVPAYIPLSTLPDAGEATFYVSQPSQGSVARLINGQKYAINSSDADRWKANPTQLTADAYGSFNTAATVDYHISVSGTKYLVDSGRLLKLGSASVIRDYDQTVPTFVDMPSDVMAYMPVEEASSLVRLEGSEAWYVLRGGNRYYIPSLSHAAAWGITATTPNLLSSKLSMGFPQAATNVLPTVVEEQSTGKYYLLDGSKHELGGVMYDSVQALGKEITKFTSNYLSDLPTGTTITSPIIQSQETKDLYTIMSGSLYHIPTTNVLNGLGYPRKYGAAQVSASFIRANSQGLLPATMFLENGGTTYFLQDGNVFPITSAAKSDWLGNRSAVPYTSPLFGNRFDVSSTNLSQFVREGNTKYIMSNGVAYNATNNQDALLANGQTWQPVAIFGITRTGSPGYLLRSSDTSDNRVWLISKGVKQHILSGSQFAAYSKQGNIPVVIVSPSLLNTFTQSSAGIDPAPLVYSDGQGFKIIDEYGAFYGFGNSDTLIHYATNRSPQNLSLSIYSNYSSYKGNLTRLIKDPSGTVYWVENGQKRWITSASAYQRYSGTPVTNVHWNLVNWLPTGSNIN